MDVRDPRTAALVHAAVRNRSRSAPRTATLADALAELDARFPGFRFRIVDEQGAIRPHIKMFVDGELARDLADEHGRRRASS